MVVPSMSSSSTLSSSLSSRSSTPSTLRTTRDLSLPSLDMPHLASTFPMPQPQYPLTMSEVIPSPPVFAAPLMQMPTPFIPAAMPEPVIPPPPSDTTFSSGTRSINVEDMPLPADYEFPAEPAAPAPVEAAVSTPRPVSPPPVIPPEPSAEITAEELTAAASDVGEDATQDVAASVILEAPVIPAPVEEEASAILEQSSEEAAAVHDVVPEEPAQPESAIVDPAPAGNAVLVCILHTILTILSRTCCYARRRCFVRRGPRTSCHCHCSVLVSRQPSLHSPSTES